MKSQVNFIEITTVPSKSFCLLSVLGESITKKQGGLVGDDCSSGGSRSVLFLTAGYWGNSGRRYRRSGY